MSTISTTPEQTLRDRRTAGALLVAGSLVSLVAMAHHPSVGAGEPARILAEMTAVAGAARVVHGVLIASNAALLLAYVDVSRLLGLHRETVRAALVAAVMSTAALSGAALLSGFVIPALGATFEGAPAPSLELFLRLASLCAIGRQLLTNVSVIAMSVAMAAWSAALLRGARASMAVGAFGLLVGGAIVLALLTGLLRLRVPDLTYLVAAQGAWNLALGVMLVVRGTRITASGAAGGVVAR